MGQRPVIAWFTGLSGAGKSTIADAVDRALTEAGRHTMVLDGDNLRHGLNRDLGFTAADRDENIRRAAETARLMAEAGLVVIVSLISPYRAERQAARGIAGDVPFLEVFIDTPLAVCEARDPKGLYDRARAGAIPNFTGISAPYEPPEAPDLLLATRGLAVGDSARPLIEALLNLSAAEPTARTPSR
ncbi:adenylyl-sulfate kinase [Methylorubrum rhodinum]|uniref:adenylyl-sulfate kinase n=1 Tax=Methylorubrum rhodinum TaxID=29428 RepID=UPI003BB1E441